MPLSQLIIKSFKQEPERIRDWERLAVEVQVLIAYSDGDLALEERMVLSMNAQLLEDPEQIQARIETLTQAIESEGLEAVKLRVLSELEAALKALPDSMRPDFAESFLHEMLHIITADQVVDDAERGFVLGDLNPILALESELVNKVLDRADDALSRTRGYVDKAFELYVLLVDAGPRTTLEDDTPTLSDSEDFLSAVSRLVVHHQLVSGSVIGYFLAALGGMSVTETYDRHCEHLADLARRCRKRQAEHGVEASVAAIHEALQGIVDSGVDPLAFSFVSTHVTSALGLYTYTDDPQRELFDQHIAPALGLDLEELRESARNMARFNPTLYRNLTGEMIGEVSPERARWWDNWM